MSLMSLGQRFARLTTDIVVPKYYAPIGYEVTVTNGSVVSLPDALHLEIRAMSGGKVTVMIEPKPAARGVREP